MKLRSLLLATAAFAFNANAAIINFDDQVANSFKDTSTDLVWMDFGINNNNTFDEVKGFVNNGTTHNNVDYSLWRLPSWQEVYSMWFTVARFNQSQIDFFLPRDGFDIDRQNRFDNRTTSGFEDTFEAMGGYNRSVGRISFPDSFTENTATGLFDGKNGVAFVSFEDIVSQPNPRRTRDDNIQLSGLSAPSGLNLNFGFEEISTLLVLQTNNQSQDPTGVSAPSTIALFGLAILGLGAARRRFRK